MKNASDKKSFWFRHLLVPICALAFTAGFAFGCRKHSPSLNAPAVKSVIEGNNTFAVELYHRVKEAPGNLCFSPYNISSVLAMTWAGARGQTQAEVANVLHFNLPPEEFHDSFAATRRQLGSLQRWNRITVLTANSIWCQPSSRIEQEFLDLCRGSYQAEVRSVDFRDTGHAANEINAWIENKTRSRIKKAVGVIKPDTRLVLCSTIYFKGKWATQFLRKNTTQMPFFVLPERSVSVSMMRQTLRSKSIGVDEDDLKLLELPYYGKSVSMIVLLSRDPAGLSDLERRMTPENLATWLSKLNDSQEEKVTVLLPRFHFDWATDLQDELSAMGMASIFNSRDADLSGMTRTPGLYVSEVIHKAYIDVNEEGTEAAAATVVKVRGVADVFQADHPFVFLIRDNQTGAILFLGRVVDPSVAAETHAER